MTGAAPPGGPRGTEAAAAPPPVTAARRASWSPQLPPSQRPTLRLHISSPTTNNVRRDDISAQDVVLSELLNARTPAAWVSAARGEAAALAALARHCQENGLVLAVTNRSNFDLVLLPRAAGLVDGIFFCGFATRVRHLAAVGCCRQVPSRCAGRQAQGMQALH